MLTVVQEHIGAKHIELVPDPDAGCLTERAVEHDRRSIRCLSDAELTTIATLAKSAERHYGTPQDIEWALDRDLPEGEDLLLLQARPETVHSVSKPDPPPAIATSGFSGLASITSSLLAGAPRHLPSLTTTPTRARTTP